MDAMGTPDITPTAVPTTTTAVGYLTNLPVTDPDCLIEREIPVPSPGPHDLLVDVEAVSVNPVDVKQRAGAPVDPRAGFSVLGYDATGTVVAVGDEVTLFTPGDAVFYAGQIDRPGTDQRLHLVDERIVGHRPASVSAAEAASLPLTMITAWEVLFDRLRLTADSAGTLLVVGATGGVGSAVLQLAEALLPQVRTIATASGAERTRWVRDLGAEYVVDHHLGEDAFADAVLTAAPRGVDRLFTAHSEGQIPLYARIMRPFGDIVAIDDGPRDVEPLKGRSVAWHWELMFTRSLEQTPDMAGQHELLEKVAELVDAAKIRPTVTDHLSPINAGTLREAHRLVESNHTLGKVVVSGWEQSPLPVRTSANGRA
ncbi:Zinc-type alcohol dehydrogenase-like protein [Corynebacterium provencense]|uniref:Zinc-type alcohol dehydrogenase-like protein n=1 Tax=Corynebacterium provencense TaxID=1737425 RepID=A0A2Z3YT20_9CORY|nr:Zinc-type alcohol dehydrogenase-like protein [Corynebacterium provencense]